MPESEGEAEVPFLKRVCAAGEPGLEILPGKDASSHAADDPSGKDAQHLNSAWTGGLPQGVWTQMDPLPGAITVNIGDCTAMHAFPVALAGIHQRASL